MDNLTAFFDGQVPYKELVLGFSWTIYLWEQYLSIRQHRNLSNPKLGVPKSLQAHVTNEEHEKARAYGRDKSWFGFFSSAYGQIQNSAVIIMNYLPFFWDLAKDVLAKVGLDGDREIMQSVVFTCIIMVLSTFMNLPLSLYSTFVIEERHGFNKQTLSLFFSDLVKEILLSLVIGAPVIAGLLMVIKWGGENFFLYVCVFMLDFQLIMVIIYPTLIQPLFNTFKPLEDGELKTKINALASRINFPLTKIFVVDGSKRSSHSNAYFYGFFKNKRIVLFDTLLEHSDQDEICGVLAHELGHWQMNHIFKMLALSQIQIFVIFYLFSKFVHAKPMYEAFGFEEQPIIIGLILFTYLYSPVDSLLSFLMHVISRIHEFQADAYAKSLGYASVLANGLIKLHKKNLGNLNPDKLYSAWHYSHPPLVERLAAIQASEKKKQ
ncbi:CAAX prenyl protease 1 [Blyttiomyces sp. JEL0837]|nr:CAAX prenyl protease 1 [Blyttiomyces sp. JEL0837]